MSVLINVGMWFERFVIIVTSLYRDFLPSSWSTYYSPTIWEVGFFLGTFGLFFTCYFLFAKYFPVIALAEVKAILKTSGENYKGKMTEMEKMDSEKFYHQLGDEIGTLDLLNMTEVIRSIGLSAGSIISGKDTPTRVQPE